jgi:hypothetical protein
MHIPSSCVQLVAAGVGPALDDHNVGVQPQPQAQALARVPALPPDVGGADGAPLLCMHFCTYSCVGSLATQS